MTPRDELHDVLQERRVVGRIERRRRTDVDLELARARPPSGWTRPAPRHASSVARISPTIGSASSPRVIDQQRWSSAHRLPVLRAEVELELRGDPGLVAELVERRRPRGGASRGSTSGALRRRGARRRPSGRTPSVRPRAPRGACRESGCTCMFGKPVSALANGVGSMSPVRFQANAAFGMLRPSSRGSHEGRGRHPTTDERPPTVGETALDGIRGGQEAFDVRQIHPWAPSSWACPTARPEDTPS